MDLEEEMITVFITELARELIFEREGDIDITLFEKVMQHITGPTGSGNAYDAPILYAMVKGRV